MTLRSGARVRVLLICLLPNQAGEFVLGISLLDAAQDEQQERRHRSTSGDTAALQMVWRK